MTLGDKVEAAMNGAGIKARTFAALVGCHYTTIYKLLENRTTVVPLNLVQEKIYKVIDFLHDAVQNGVLPLDASLSVVEKTKRIVALHESYNAPNTDA